MSFFAKPPRHRAYVLRIWEERPHQSHQTPDWRFSLEDPDTGKRRGFAELQALVSFLQVELARSSRESAAEQDDQSRLSRLIQVAKDTLRPLSEAELDIAAAAGNDQSSPIVDPSPEDDERPNG